MGVPGFVAWLYRNHKQTNFIFRQLFKLPMIDENSNVDLDRINLNDNMRVESVQNLFIDANCLIHPKAREVSLDNPNLVESNLELLEKKIITEIINYIELLIEQTKPTNIIYIAVDGVAPMAKIKHQRLRRFKTVYDRKRMEEINKKHKKTYQKEWNTSAITPGTIFMDKLTKSILTWIKSNNKHTCEIIFSSSYTPGEGEHKILQYIRNSNLPDTDINVIYGLDADLLFLSLALKKEYIYLMRETSQMESNQTKYTDGFSYLSIDILGNTIYDIVLEHISHSNRHYDKYSIINDFVFLCYFCGNDFLPNIPSLNIKPPNKKIFNGIDTIFETYAKCMKELNVDINHPSKYLINIHKKTDGSIKIHINYELFMNILTVLSDLETEYFNKLYKCRRYFKRCDSSDPCEIDKFNYEENIISKYEDEIKLGDTTDNLNNWKQRYYKHYFNIDIDTTNLSDNSLNIILDEYIKGLVWTTYYYYDKCKDYEWFYHHHHGPFVSDIKRYIERFPSVITKYEELYEINGIWFKNQIKPLQQLMLVLPHESSYLIPSAYRTLMFGYNLKKYFPDKITDIKIDYLHKSKAWQNILMLDIIPPRLILKLTSKIILKEELERNGLYNNYVKNPKINELTV
jgi:5'-3' exoribonuclease 2